ncbi:unnamed protein product, partial [Medioppia subpectinata]
MKGPVQDLYQDRCFRLSTDDIETCIYRKAPNWDKTSHNPIYQCCIKWLTMDCARELPMPYCSNYEYTTMLGLIDPAITYLNNGDCKVNQYHPKLPTCNLPPAPDWDPNISNTIYKCCINWLTMDCAREPPKSYCSNFEYQTMLSRVDAAIADLNNHECNVYKYYPELPTCHKPPVRELLANTDTDGGPTHVIATTRQATNAALDELRDRHSNLHVLHLEAQDYYSYPEFSKRVEALLGGRGLDTLINNAGIMDRTSLAEVTLEQMIDSYHVNALAPFMLIKALLPLLKASSSTRKTAIINMTMASIPPKSPSPYPYRSSKSAFTMISQCLAADLIDDGITVLNINPGHVNTYGGDPDVTIDIETSGRAILNHYYYASVLITGANRGIGLGLVTALLAKPNGGPTHVIATTRQATNAALDELRDRHSNLHVLQLDGKRYETFAAFAVKVAAIVGDMGVDCLINNAGIALKQHLADVTAQGMIENFEISAAKQRKTIVINVSSMLGSIGLIGQYPFKFYYPYQTSKAALNMITKCLSVDLKAHGIQVIGLHPGHVKTDMAGPDAPLDVTQSVSAIYKAVA